MTPRIFLAAALVVGALLPAAALAQAPAAPKPATPKVAATLAQWHLLDPAYDGVLGAGVTRAYAELPRRRPAPVVVAVIDTGIDTAHADLKPALWTNPGEIPGNGLDDDQNGYVDDVHGWNFLGNATGRNLTDDNLELARVVACGAPRFAGRLRAQVPVAEQAEFDEFEAARTEYQARLATATTWRNKTLQASAPWQRIIADLRRQLPTSTAPLDTGRLRQRSATRAGRRAGPLLALMRDLGVADTDALLDRLSPARQLRRFELKHGFDLSDTVRTAAVQDDPYNLHDRYYGNNDVYGYDPGHGTHVAGIIGAVRHNGLGVDGIAGPTVRLMAVRVVPDGDGDERDKDVANAIRYAVDNGAAIINMSFGKYYSPQRAAVADAIRYAASRNVLLVAAAGNDSANLDVQASYPAAAAGLDAPPAPNLLVVGASDARAEVTTVPEFSNYGRHSVDLFAPGMGVVSTLPSQLYGPHNGTSMAAPMVAGVAAVLKAYYPRLTAADLKRLIRASAVTLHTPVWRPGTVQKVDFAELSSTGGIVNLARALQLARQEAEKQP